MTIIGIAVVFPIVFSIGGAYKRREVALSHYGKIKSYARMLYFASRDWVGDTGQDAQRHNEELGKLLGQTLTIAREYFLAKTRDQQETKEEALYTMFSRLSAAIENFRARGLGASEVSRANAFLAHMITAFENLKHIFQYRTPRTLRTYSRVFIYIIPIIYAPYFAYIADGKAWPFAYILPILFALIFTSLDKIQEQLENPFDQVGEDDITINVDKFERNITLR